jgi:alpha-L-fucosidase
VGTPLPNPDSGLDATVLPDGSTLAVANDSSTDRSRLSLMRSPDLGRSWQRVAVLAEAEGQEYSYPSIVRSTDGLFHVSYTHERTRIAHVAFNARWLAGLVARGTHGP